MDPLVKVREAFARGAIPEEVFSRIVERFPLVTSGIDRIEGASGMDYPVAYVEPSVITTRPDPGSFQYGILFARTIPLSNGRFQVVIQISAPLVAYGLKGTIHAILAHEFLHFLELIHRVSKMRIVSDEVTGSIFENVYADGTRLFEPGAVFRDRTLMRHITKRFPAGFRDYKLEDKTIKFWIEKGLPRTDIALEENIAKLSASSLAEVRLDPKLLAKLEYVEKKSARIQKRRAY